MRTAVEAFLIALPANDVASSAHRSRNDPEIAFARANRALACYEDVLAEMVLSRDIVVVAVDGFYLGLDRLTAKRPIDGTHRRAEHDLPVRQRASPAPSPPPRRNRQSRSCPLADRRDRRPAD